MLLIVLDSIDFNPFTPNALIFSKHTSNAKTITPTKRTIVITAKVLFTNCFDVGQITFFNSAFVSLKKILFFYAVFIFFTKVR